MERYTFANLAVSGEESFLDFLLEMLDERSADKNGNVELLDQEMEALELESDMMQWAKGSSQGYWLCSAEQVNRELEKLRNQIRAGSLSACARFRTFARISTSVSFGNLK